MEKVRNMSVHVGTLPNTSEPWVGAWERPWHIGTCQYRWEHVGVSGHASVDCSIFLLVQSKGEKMAVTNLFCILSPVKLNESVLE